MKVKEYVIENKYKNKQNIDRKDFEIKIINGNIGNK